MQKRDLLYCIILLFTAFSSLALANPILPSNIVAYIPITLTNYQNTAVAANTPVAIGTYSSSGNIIGFNALAYKEYELPELNNTEFFFANGTVATSWLEGNILNENTANSVATGFSSANALADSANVLWWVKIPTNSFLAANSANTIYMGWAGNVITPANILMNGITTGEAPQLSSLYGLYDNGAEIFTSYLDFKGNTLPSNYNAYTAGSTYSINNGFSTTIGYSSYIDIMSANTFSYPLVLELYTNTITVNAGTPVFPFIAESTSKTIGGDINTVYVGPDDGYAATDLYLSGPYSLYIFDTLSGSSTESASTYGPNSIISMVWGNSMQAAYRDYNSIGTTSSTDVPIGNYYLTMGGGTGSAGQGSYTADWFRARIYPPNGIMPEDTYGAVSKGVILPSNVINYIPITLTNYQNTAVAANTPIPIGTTAYGNIIGFNAIAYQQYETCNLNNVEFFLSNGTVLNSWMEGNLLNEQAANTLCASDSSQNALAASANILYWVKIPTSSFLPANTGTATTNTIYMGWAGNVLSNANNLLSNTITGEAPQLSCTNPASTASGCIAGQYGEYDNGANVFNLYMNFSGTSSSAPSGWSFIEVGGGTLAIDNGVSLYGALGESAALYRNLQIYPVGNVLEGFITSITPSSDELVALDTATPTGNNAGGTWWGLPGNAIGAGAGGGNPARLELVYSDSGSAANVKGATNTIAPYIASASWQSTDAIGTINYTINEYAGGSAPIPGLAYPIVYVNNNQNINAQWFRSRILPPNGVFPESAIPIPSPTLSFATFTSNPTLPSTQTVGNTITFTASWTGGTSSYTANYIITNTVTGNLVANMLFIGITGTSNSFAWTIPSVDAGNTLQANVIITDSSSTPETTNSVKSGTLTIVSGYTPPSTPTLSSCPSSIHLDVGQSVSCTASVSGGTSPYTYNWLISNSITNAITANMLLTGISSTSNTFTYTTSSADTSNSPEQFNVIVTDSNPTTVNSIYSSTFTTNPALGTPTLSSSPTLPSTQTVGNTITFTASWTGGTSSYTANYIITNTVTGNLVANMLFTGITGTSNSFAWTIPSVDAGNTLQANVIIIDSASTPETVNSPYGSTITVVSNSQPSQQGNIMYLVNGAGTSNIVIINLATNTVTGSITSGINNPGGLSISPSGTYAYLTNYYGENAVIINIATNTVTGAITSGFSSPQGVSFSPSGAYAYVANFDSNNVVIINTATNTVTGSITTGLNTPYGVSISPSGTYAYVTNYAENSISIINTASNTVTGSITAGIAYPKAVAISPSGTYAYVYNQKNNNVVIINTASNTVTGAITSGFAYSTGIAFSPSTKYAYVTNFDSNNVVIINTVTNTVTGSITEGSKESVSIAFVPASVPSCATPDSSPLSVPTNIIAYAPINICNFQSDSTIAPFQQELNINSSKYMAFEANNLDNIEFFYSNGTTIPSWLEGNNMLSGEQFGVSSSSKSTVYWLNITKGMPADSNLSIFMGFAAASTNLMNGNSIGEEPGLSGIYAQYDNGNKIFDFYMNANSIPSVEDPNSISIYQAGAVGSSPQLSVTSNPTTGKAISVTPSSTGEDTYYFMNAPHIPTQFIETAWYYTTGNAFDAWIGALNGGSLNGYSAMTGDSFNSQLSIYLDSARSLMQQVPYVYPYNEWLSEGMAYQDGNITAYSGNGLSLLQFGTNLTATNALYSSFNTVFFAPYIGTSAYTRLLGLISVRAAPPNGIMPQTAYGNLSAIMQQSNITVSNTIIDVGQSSTLSATISGGNGAIGGEWALVASNNLNNNVVNTINFPSGGSGLAVSPTGSFAYVTIGPNAGTVDVLNLISNSIAGSFSVGDTPEEVAINPAGTIAYVPNYGSRTISVVSTASNSVVTTIDTSFYPTAVNFNPQGNLAYVDSPASRVYIVDVSSNTIVNSINVGNYPDGTVFSKNGAYAYIADLNSGSISIINVSENRTVNTILISPSAFTTDVAVNPDGTLLYATNENGNNVSVISTATNTVVNTINVGNGPWSIYLNPTGSLAYVINAYDNKVSVINTATNTVIDNVSAPTIGSLGAFSPITNIFYALGYSELSGISIPQTNNQPLPGSGYSHTMQLTVNAFSSNALLLTFNGVRYIESSGSNDIFGNYGISAYVNDSTSPIYQTIIMSNTLKVNPALDGKLFTASNSYIDNTQYKFRLRLIADM